MTAMQPVYLSCAQAAPYFPSIDGQRISARTIWRWGRYGIYGIRLRLERVGGRFVTTPEWIAEFRAALAEIPPGRREAAQRERAMRRSPARRARAIERANRRAAAIA